VTRVLLKLFQKSIFNSGSIVAINLRETLQQYKILKQYSNSLFWIDTHGTSLTYKTSSFLLAIITLIFMKIIFI
jgi:hypothetical protein